MSCCSGSCRAKAAAAACCCLFGRCGCLCLERRMTRKEGGTCKQQGKSLVQDSQASKADKQKLPPPYLADGPLVLVGVGRKGVQLEARRLGKEGPGGAVCVW